MAEKRIHKEIASLQPKQAISGWGWVEWKRKSEILLCTCGSRYIKTRKGQKTCVRCMRA